MKRRIPSLSVLPNLDIVRPCPLKDFSKDFQCQGVHNFCTLCKETVYTLSEMSEDEICSLLEEKQGHFCASVERHPDGSLVTKDSRAKFLPQALVASSLLIASNAAADQEILRGGVTASPPIPGKIAISEVAQASPTPTATPTPAHNQAPMAERGKVKITVRKR